MELQWVLIVMLSNSMQGFQVPPQMVSFGAFETREGCAEARASYLLMKEDKAMRDFFFAWGESKPVGAKCLPRGTEAQIRDYIAKHPEDAEKAKPPPKTKTGNPNQR